MMYHENLISHGLHYANLLYLIIVPVSLYTLKLIATYLSDWFKLLHWVMSLIEFGLYDRTDEVYLHISVWTYLMSCTRSS